MIRLATMTFPRLLGAVEKRDSSQWEIGDALVEECGPPSESSRKDGGYQKIEAASQYLLGFGYDYSVTTLAQYREIAFDFPKRRRHADLSFSAHKSAGSPDALDRIVRSAPKGQRISPDYVIAVRAAQRRTERAQRDQARKAAKAPPKASLAVETGIWTEFGLAAKTVRNLDKQLTAEVLARIRETTLGSMRVDAIAALNAWQRIAERLGKMSRRGQLAA